MARPQRCRRICFEPEVCSFSPEGGAPGEAVVLSLDEFEAIRLVDAEGRTHAQCAAQMDISRTTVTEICERAHRKIAQSLVSGRALVIAGGNYRLCDGSAARCCCGPCRFRANKTEQGEEGNMRIAVTYENGEIFQHFGHTEQFKLYEVQDGKVVRSQVIDTLGSGHGALAGFLRLHEVTVLICGGIGGGARMALEQAGIQLYGGVQGSADDAVQAFIDGKLEYNPDVMCSHHDHGEGHSCGEHGHNCGNGGCH